ncbi:hypothetical protein, partial [Frankia sp. CiP3]|uniref:hypothetical protein n=1 Tax=Frankia sp. CiP3 TaxID=2880971 RepID=UPI001EF5E7DF
ALHTAVLRRVLPVVAAVGAAGIAAAPAILKIFGTTYAEQATTLLRLLLLGGMARAVTVLAVCAARARRQAGRIVVLQAVPAMIITVGVWQFAQPRGLPAVGLAWVAGQSVTAMIAVMISRPASRACFESSVRAIHAQPAPGFVVGHTDTTQPVSLRPSALPGTSWTRLAVRTQDSKQALRARLNSGHNTNKHNVGGHNDVDHNSSGHNSDVAVPVSVTAESITTEKRGA